LNATLQITAEEGFDANSLLQELINSIRDALARVRAEPGHVKIMLRSQDDAAIANLVSSDRAPEVSQYATDRINGAELIINARVEVDSRVLQKLIKTSVDCIAAKNHLRVVVQTIEQLATGPADMSCKIPNIS
jgi:hypothetical protein